MYTSTHNLCFGAKIRKILDQGKPLHSTVLLHEIGVQGGMYTSTHNLCFGAKIREILD